MITLNNSLSILLYVVYICNNTFIILQDLKGLKNRPGTVSPPNITHLVALDTSTLNKIEMVYDKTIKVVTI